MPQPWPGRSRRLERLTVTVRSPPPRYEARLQIPWGRLTVTVLEDPTVQDATRPPPDVGREALRAPPAQADLEFLPESFFLGRTVGAGVVRDPFGRIVRRCNILTDGSFDAVYRAIHFDETFTYDDGEVDIWRWIIRPGRDGRYMAAERLAGPGITGERQGGDYVTSFRRPVGRARGMLAPRFTTRFTLLAPELALKHARVSLFGLPLGALTAFHRRDDRARPN